jgi:hypothetical protein
LIFLFVFLAVAVSSAVGALVMIIWGNVLLGRDSAQARAIRAAIDINRMVIEARRKMVDAAVHGVRGDWRP